MFTHQNESSGKFWVTAFVVGLLIFLGQFANSQTISCKNYAKGTCYFPETVTVLNNNQQAAIAQCKFGNNYCLKAACKNKQMYWTGSNNPAERCSNTPPKKEEEPAQTKVNCKDPLQEKEIFDDVSKIVCVCKYTGNELAAGEKCEEKKPETQVSRNNWCSQMSGILGIHLNGSPYDSNPTTCYCFDEDGTPTGTVVQGGQKCNAPAAAATTTEPQTTTASFMDRMESVAANCGHKAMQAKLDECAEDSGEAVAKCDADAAKSGENADQLGQVMKLLGTVQMQKAVKHGDADACGKAAYIGSGAALAIDLVKADCGEKVKQCKSKCQALKDGESFTKLKQNCENMYNREFANELGISGTSASATGRATFKEKITDKQLQRVVKNGKAPEVTSAEDGRAVLREDIAEMEKKAKDNLVKCEADAVKGETDIAKYLSELLTASIAAQQCKNAVTNGNARCLAIATQLTPQYCQANPSETCCCSMNGTCIGSGGLDCANKDYANQKCICARTPDAAVCKTTTTAAVPTLTNPGGVSTLAAPGGIKAGSQYKPSGTAGSGFEVGTDMDPSKATNSASTGGSTNPFGAAGGGGGGGGGGVPNSPNDGAGAAPAAAESAGSGLVGGAFNQLKTLADRVFGTGSGNSSGKNFGNGTGKDGKGKGDLDPNKWKPGLRGLAGGSSPFGPKNKDIWKIMNAQYGIQNHTFISNDK